MWKYWYQLTPAQKIQARDLDTEVAQEVSRWIFYVDTNGNVTGYITAIGYDNLGVE